METLTQYIPAISARGDTYGGHGGILDLLSWSGKQGTMEITLDDAKRFYENPDQPYFREGSDVKPSNKLELEL